MALFGAAVTLCSLSLAPAVGPAAARTPATAAPFLVFNKGVFSDYAPRKVDLFALAAGGEARPVVQLLGYDTYNAALTPGGGTLAFVRSTNDGGRVVGPPALFRSASDGSSPTPLTPESFVNGDDWPSWSPDGGAVAFGRIAASAGSAPAYRLFRADRDGAEVRQLTTADAPAGAATLQDVKPSWSSRDRLFFVRTSTLQEGLPAGARSEIWSVQPDGTEARAVLKRGQYDWPQVSPDGRRLVVARWFGGQRDLYVFNTGGTRGRRLTRSRLDDTTPSWSPKGDRIVFARGVPDQHRLFVLDWRRGRLRRVDRLGGQVDPQRGGQVDAQRPVWLRAAQARRLK